jgi:hypothetical protein
VEEKKEFGGSLIPLPHRNKSIEDVTKPYV